RIARSKYGRERHDPGGGEHEEHCEQHRSLPATGAQRHPSAYGAPPPEARHSAHSPLPTRTISVSAGRTRPMASGGGRLRSQLSRQTPPPAAVSRNSRAVMLSRPVEKVTEPPWRGWRISVMPSPSFP